MSAVNTLVAPEKLFLVMFKNGVKRFVLADGESDLPLNIDDVSFAANLPEMMSLVKEMNDLLALGIDESDGGLVLRIDQGAEVNK